MPNLPTICSQKKKVMQVCPSEKHSSAVQYLNLDRFPYTVPNLDRDFPQYDPVQYIYSNCLLHWIGSDWNASVSYRSQTLDCENICLHCVIHDHNMNRFSFPSHSDNIGIWHVRQDSGMNKFFSRFHGLPKR